MCIKKEKGETILGKGKLKEYNERERRKDIKKMKTERLYRKRKQKRYEERESRINTSAEEKGHEYIYISKDSWFKPRKLQNKKTNELSHTDES